jgi:hypothetical protein
MSEESEFNDLRLYLKYEYLDTNTLIHIFRLFNDIHSAIISFTYPVYYVAEVETPFPNYIDLSYVKIGESIEFKFKEGWKPELNIKKGKLEIKVPKNLGVIAIATYLLLEGATRLYDLRIKRSDLELKEQQKTINELDIRLKSIELYKKMKESPDSLLRKTHRATNAFILYLYTNPEITHVEIGKNIIIHKNSENDS